MNTIDEHVNLLKEMPTGTFWKAHTNWYLTNDQMCWLYWEKLRWEFKCQPRQILDYIRV